MASFKEIITNAARRLEKADPDPGIEALREYAARLQRERDELIDENIQLRKNWDMTADALVLALKTIGKTLRDKC